MSSEKAEAPADAGPSKGPLLLALVNTVAILAVMGTVVYTKMMYKRPVITEDGERARLAAIRASPTPPAAPGLVNFEPISVNIASNPTHPKAADGTARQIQGKHHYATMGFALEIRDIAKKDRLELLRPILMDKMLSMLGRKGFHELVTVQGRYILRAQILELANQLIAKDASESERRSDALVTNVFFTHFVVQ